MFVVIDEGTGAFVNTEDVTHVQPRDDSQPGSYIMLRDDAEVIYSPLSPTEVFRLFSA